ncbi:MAG: peptidoglycan-binding protein, partial [Patescibacteria group bacterium]|nr:peptidoglycan-binding protein [Patescibacteria group bacterium]
MKKYSVILITIIISVPFGSDASINSNLNYGSTGEQVIELQQFLIKENYLKASATGDFYSLTLRAVKAFQKANDISATGYVGPLTRAAVNSWSSKGGTATVVNPTQSVSECPLGYSCVRSSSVQLQALAVSSANDNVSAKGSASITFSSATNQSAFNVSANGQHLNLPILTTYVTPS